MLERDCLEHTFYLVFQLLYSCLCVTKNLQKIIRSSSRRIFKKDVLKNFAIFTWKLLSVRVSEIEVTPDLRKYLAMKMNSIPATAKFHEHEFLSVTLGEDMLIFYRNKLWIRALLNLPQSITADCKSALSVQILSKSIFTKYNRIP